LPDEKTKTPPPKDEREFPLLPGVKKKNCQRLSDFIKVMVPRGVEGRGGRN